MGCCVAASCEAHSMCVARALKSQGQKKCIKLV